MCGTEARINHKKRWSYCTTVFLMQSQSALDECARLMIPSKNEKNSERFCGFLIGELRNNVA